MTLDPSDADANDATIRNALAALETCGGEITLPGGTYPLNQPIAIRRQRNIVLRGAGGNFVNPGTRLIYRGREPAGCLTMSTAVHCRIEALCFVAESPAAVAVTQIDAIEGSPNAVSSLNNTFRNCTFRGGPGVRPAIPGVALRDTGHTAFEHCWFQTDEIAARIGAPMRHPAPTISNGQCSNTTFDQCLFFADLVGERGTNVTVQNCEFATRRDGTGAKIDFGTGENPQVCCVTLRDNLAINGAAHRGTFFTQGKGGAGLVMMNNRIRGYAVAVDLDGAGAAHLTSNVFEQTASGAIDIRVRCATDAISLAANLHSKTIEAGNPPVVCG